MTKNLKALGLLMLLMSASPSIAQGVKPLPSLHTEGRYVVDKHGNHVVHGVMDTPVNMKFYKADMEHLPRGIYIIGGKKIIK